MEAETFRYLLSALIQVFGALIALDVVVLVLRYQGVRNRLDLTAFELGKVLAMIDGFKKILWDGERSEHVRSEAALFQSLDLKKRDEKIGKVKNDLDSDIEEMKQKIQAAGRDANKLRTYNGKLSEMEQAEKELIEKKTHYQRLADEVKFITLAATKIMALPSGTVVLFAILLCHADTVCGTWLVGIAWGAVAISAIVLFTLVVWARKLFESS